MDVFFVPVRGIWSVRSPVGEQLCSDLCTGSWRPLLSTQHTGHYIMIRQNAVRDLLQMAECRFEAANSCTPLPDCIL